MGHRRRKYQVAQPVTAPGSDVRGRHEGASPAYDVLSDTHAQEIIDATYAILRDVGVGFEPDPRVMELFSNAGCEITADSLVRFPTRIVENALSGMAKSTRLWNRPGNDSIKIDGEHTWFFTGMTCIKVFDDITGEARDSNREDLARVTRVSDALSNIDAVSIGCKNVEHSGICGEVDEFITLVQNTEKPLEYLCEYPESLAAVLEIAATIRGGREALADKPYFMHLVTPLPLYYAKIHTDQIIMAVEAGVPLAMGTVTIGGASAPITMAGCITHSLATDFAGMVLAQLLRPGAFCIGGSDSAFMEAATGGIGAFSQTSMADMAMCQISRKLGFPSLTGVGGCANARRFNQDAVWEISSTMMQTFYSRPATCDYLGSLDEGITFSLHALLLGNELAGLLRKMWQGLAVDEDSMAMELTFQEGPRGNYLAQEHTVRHCRTEGWDAQYLGAKLPVSSGSRPDLDLFERLDEDLQRILQNHTPVALDPEITKQILSNKFCAVDSI